MSGGLNLERDNDFNFLTEWGGGGKPSRTSLGFVKSLMLSIRFHIFSALCPPGESFFLEYYFLHFLSQLYGHNLKGLGVDHIL